MKNILLALDLRQDDQSLVTHAGQMAQKFDTRIRIWVVHIAAADPDFVSYTVEPSYIRDTRANELRKEHKLLAVIADQFNSEGLSAEGLLIQGPTVQMMEDEVVKLSIDLVVWAIVSVAFGTTLLWVILVTNWQNIYPSPSC